MCSGKFSYFGQRIHASVKDGNFAPPRKYHLKGWTTGVAIYGMLNQSWSTVLTQPLGYMCVYVEGGEPLTMANLDELAIQLPTAKEGGTLSVVLLTAEWDLEAGPGLEYSGQRKRNITAHMSLSPLPSK